MDDRTCLWCAASLEGMRSNARYCSRQHKKNDASRRHRERNPGYFARYSRSEARLAYVEANRESLRERAREYQRNYRQQQAEEARRKAADWWAANLDRHRLYQAKRRAAKLAGGFKVTERDIRRMFARYRWTCAYCGRGGVPLHIDHVVPLKLGGQHRVGNLLPACQPCNSSKSARLLAAWKYRR